MIFVVVFVLQSCLKNDTPSEPNSTLSSNALLLNYLESQGDYINSVNMPSIVDVDEVYNNLNNYLIIDTRAKDEYTAGHIPGAINVTNDSLIIFINQISNINKYQKIILVSTDGQSAAYYTCLLQLYGIKNTYSLNFGMAQWNHTFSDVWKQNIHNSAVVKYLEDSHIYPSDANNKLPNVNFNLPNGTVEDNVHDLILQKIKEGFVNDKTFVTVSGEPIFNDEDISKFYIICYGKQRLYDYIKFFPYPSGHFHNTYYYKQGDFKSTKFLQSLPNDKRIVIYTVSGQVSAFLVAYLRLLGYDAMSLSFGANSFFHSRLLYDVAIFSPYVFLQNDIRDYQYITGDSPK